MLALLAAPMSPSHNKKLPETVAVNTSKSTIPTEFFLSLATAPTLLGILALGAVSSWLQTTGIASEEVFRGERLPVLHFPEKQE